MLKIILIHTQDECFSPKHLKEKIVIMKKKKEKQLCYICLYCRYNSGYGKKIDSVMVSFW